MSCVSSHRVYFTPGGRERRKSLRCSTRAWPRDKRSCTEGGRRRRRRRYVKMWSCNYQNLNISYLFLAADAHALAVLLGGADDALAAAADDDAAADAAAHVPGFEEEFWTRFFRRRHSHVTRLEAVKYHAKIMEQKGRREKISSCTSLKVFSASLLPCLPELSQRLRCTTAARRITAHKWRDPSNSHVQNPSGVVHIYLLGVDSSNCSRMSETRGPGQNKTSFPD